MSQGKGTPPKEIDLESLCRSFTETNIRKLGGYATGKDVAEATSLKAIELLLGYGYGKPKSRKEVTGVSGGPVTVKIVYGPDDDGDEYKGK